MTETREAIIKLIEPYMDKTLHENMLVRYKWWIYYLRDVWYWNNFNDIGSYDITAVLKYIDDNSWYIEWYYLAGGDINIYENMLYPTERSIPNKPLHLYTEQEEKDLLELLTKLKWKQ